MAGPLALLPLLKSLFSIKGLFNLGLGGLVASQAADFGLKAGGNLFGKDLSLNKTILGTELTDKEKKQAEEELVEGLQIRSGNQSRRKRVHEIQEEAGLFDDVTGLPNQLELQQAVTLLEDLAPLILASGKPLSEFAKPQEGDSDFLRAILTTKERKTINDARIEASFGPPESSEDILAGAGINGGIPQGSR